jgi:23S rRNA (guanosine2251-2'-O)-methyltransferase
MRLYGKNPVLERLKSNPRSIQRIYLEIGHPEASYIHLKARKWGIPVIPVTGVKIQKLTRNLNAQGLLAEVAEFSYLPYPELVSKAAQEKRCLLFLDGLNDPQNLGAMVRSLSCLGSFAIVLPTHNSVSVTDTVLRVACGGENYLPFAKVNNLNQAIIAAKAAGYWLVGAELQGQQNIYETRFVFPVALVVGSEQKGIREVIKRQLDVLVSIPMAQERLSLNVAQATAIFAYEIIRQKKQLSHNFKSNGTKQ